MIIGCKLPNGIVLRHPLDPTKTVEINGMNRNLIIGGTYVTTNVDDEFWSNWIAVHADFPAVTSGALWAVKSEKDVKAVAREHADRKTGFEGMKPTDGGVKPADKD